MPSEDLGQLIVVATIWAGLAFGLAGLSVLTLKLRFCCKQGKTGQPSWGLALWLWTLGWMATGLHALAAYHWTFGWDQQAVFQHTAEETLAALASWGLTRLAQTLSVAAWGWGVLGNYLFLAVWATDVALWAWTGRPAACRGIWQAVTIYGFLGFITFNATVVFKTGMIRWLGLAATLWCLGLLWYAFRGRAS